MFKISINSKYKAQIAGKTFSNAQILGVDAIKLLIVPENSSPKHTIITEIL